MLANSLGIGGAETQLVRIAAGLAESGHEVTVASLLRMDELRPVLDRAGVPVVDIPTAGLAGPVTALAATVGLLRRRRPEVVVSFDYQSNVLGRLAGRTCGVPVVVSSIRSEHFGGPRRDAVLRLTDRACTLTVVNSEAAADGLTRRGVVPPTRLRVIPNGIDVAAHVQSTGSREGVRAQLGVRPDAFLWLAVGHLRPQKDYANLLRAVRQLRPGSGPGYQVRIAGAGDLLDELRAMAAGLGVDDRVRFLGPRADVPDLLAAADALVLSSRHEGMPNAVMEALAVGLPVVATTVGGVAELVQDSGSGRLVPREDPVELGAAMRGLMALPEARRRVMGEAGRAHVTDQYTVPRAVQRWETLLVDSVERAGRRRRVRG